MSDEPSGLLEMWYHRAATGRALDLGAGEGSQARWLAKQGFTVDALERDPSRFHTLVQESVGLAVVPIEGDLRSHLLTPDTYDLIVASAVLHFLRPTELWPLVDRVEAALKPGGLLLVEVLTCDDPGFEALREAGGLEVEPNTFSVGEPIGVIHYFAPGELERLFANLIVLDYQEARRLDQKSDEGYRAGASLVARRPD